MKGYLIRAIRIWYMQKFWRSERFHREYPKEYSIATIVRFIDGHCNKNEGQNFYKGYPFVYYIKRNLIRCGVLVKGHVYYSSFNCVEEFCTVKDIAERIDRVIENRKYD